jgi:hypothetical protein
MNLTVDIAPDLESRLLQEAAKQGVDPSEFVAAAVRARLHSDSKTAPCLDAEQSRLVEDINRGLSESKWNRYYALIAKRQQGLLTEDEYAELVATSHDIEVLNARRMQCLAELARLRGTNLSDLLDQLGIVPPPVI